MASQNAEYVNTVDYIIVGGGISGLSHLHFAIKSGKSACLIEKSDKTGGKILTKKVDDFLLEEGPNAFVEDNNLNQIIKDLNLKKWQIFPEIAAKKRCIVKNKKLHTIAPKPFTFLKTPLFSPWAKLKFISEGSQPRKKSDADQSVAQFIKRRFGKEILNYAVDPMLAGIYAGNPNTLSANAVFPRLVRWEKQYGSVLKGLRKEKNQFNLNRSIFTFANGNQTLTNTIYSTYKSHVFTGATVAGLKKEDAKWKVDIKKPNGTINTMHAKHLILALPSAQIKALLLQFGFKAAAILPDIEYNRIDVMHLAYPADAIKNKKTNAFGFLVPAKEKLHFLGVVFDSVIFPHRAPDGQFLITVFLCGERDITSYANNEEIWQNKAQKEIEQILKIKANAGFRFVNKWPLGIPAYKVGHLEKVKLWQNTIQNIGNIKITGNFLHGIGIKDCVADAANLKKH